MVRLQHDLLCRAAISTVLIVMAIRARNSACPTSKHSLDPVRFGAVQQSAAAENFDGHFDE